MKKVSVLMSVYNETINEITESIESILAQSHVNLEFLIVNDNPERNQLKEYLRKYEMKDNRIKIFNNKQNIGLALSLNKIAHKITSDFIVRMDADDISLPDRIEKQLMELDNGYDVVFSPYTYIDEHSKAIEIISDNHNYYEPIEIHKTLPVKNIIHHPTVIMKREIFEKVGGYRDFKVAQDYDLWLRIYDAGGKFKMVNEPLLKYRIRDNSVSQKKKFEQKVTLDYTRRLFMERVTQGGDSYTKENHKKIMDKYKCFDDERRKDYKSHSKTLLKAKEARSSQKYFKYFLYRLRVFLLSNEHRKSYLHSRIEKIRLNKYIKTNLKFHDLV